MVDVRRLDPSSWTVYREVRLAALAESPGAFGTTVEQASARTEEEWQACLWDRVNFVAFNADRPVGLVSGIPGPDPDCAELISMWVAPEHRRRSVGERLVHEVAAWAREEGYRELRLGVVDDNGGARAFYERLGFTPTGLTYPYPNDPQRWELELTLPLAP
jgi:ribosomal protein S18 acetylase RimI-like enzyme